MDEPLHSRLSRRTRDGEPLGEAPLGHKLADHDLADKIWALTAS